jgi:hypothetical protein
MMALWNISTGPSPIHSPSTRDPKKRHRLRWMRNLLRTRMRMNTENIFISAGMGVTSFS